jgi:beta-xylosidase
MKSNAHCRVRRLIIPLLVLGGFGLSAGRAQQAAGDQPAFRPGEVWPDDQGVHINAHGGGILLHEGVYYWFGEHKIGGDAGNLAQVGVHVYSSKDLYGWQDRGIALRVSDDPASDITKGCAIERPKVVFNAKTGKFVMWFHLEHKGNGYKSALAAIAVSDAPIGPYTYVRAYRPNKGIWPVNVTEEDKVPKAPDPKLSRLKAAIAGQWLRRDFELGQMSRDMTIFEDDDGKAYLVTSAEENATMHIAELTDDYQGFTGRWSRALVGDSNEGPAVFKRNGKYYMISSGTTGFRPNPGRSAVADSIFGPWTRLGNPCRGTPREVATTFGSQSTYILPAPGKPDSFIFMADRWHAEDAIDGRYVWLPVQWEGDKPVIRWHDRWQLNFFDNNP